MTETPMQTLAKTPDQAPAQPPAPPAAPAPAIGEAPPPVQTQSPATVAAPLALQPAPATTQGGLAAPQTLEQTLALRDIHPPGPPPAWPPALGWWLLLALAIGAAVALTLRGWRAWRARVRRRRILAELAQVGERAQGAALAGEVSALLKRVALSRFDHGQVAPLTGPNWLDFLDRHGGSGRFANGPGRVLAEGPYALAPEVQPQALLALAREWVERNT